MILRVLSCLLGFSLCIASVSTAQKRLPATPLEVDSAHRPFDVLSYDLELDWRQIFKNKVHRFSGVNHIALVTTEPTDTIVLDAGTTRIDSIAIDGTPLVPLVQPDNNDQIHIPLPHRSLGDHWKIDIAYTHVALDNQGLYFYPKGTYAGIGPAQDSVFTAEDIAYTMSEPLDAHFWMPCMDRPYDKATSAIAIRVPAGISAQSNGLLSRIDTNQDGSMTYRWTNSTPISTYLMVADASNFVEWTTWYTRVTDTTQKVPIYNYAWPVDYEQTEDKSGFKYNAQWALRNTPRMLAEYSKRFGEYPFVKYGMVPAQKFDFGGMEHQTLTTINRSWFRGWYEDGIAHELMHQWFGDKTTCATWADIWLNEGFASYGEAIWEEANGGTPAYESVIRNQAQGFFNPRSLEVNSIPVYDPPIDAIFNYPTTYAKGSCVLHMLRRALNDDTLFFNAIRDYSNAFAYTSATTAQFTSYMTYRLGARMPVDFHDFIDEWIMTGGYPLYEIRWAAGSNGVLVIQVDQTQPGRSYSMPLRFIAQDASLSKTFTALAIDTARTQIFKFRYDTPVAWLIVDSSALVLGRYSVSYDPSLEALGVTGVAERETRVTPTAAGWDVSFSAATSTGWISLRDVLGREVLRMEVPQGAAHAAIPSNRIPHGVFWGRFKNSESATSFRIEN
jgi:aminopeptidase N